MKNENSSIKELRAKAGMTQKAFSSWLNIPKRTIEAWEMGQRIPPSYVVELIAFRVDHDEGLLKNEKTGNVPPSTTR